MGDEFTGPDALRLYHCGASSDEAVQTDPDLSWGAYKSSSEATNVAWSESGLPSNITVEYIGGNTSLGAATLAFPTSDTAQYTPPGGSIGSAVSIANGETKIIRGGGAYYDQYVRITRTSATALAGSATLTIVDTNNNCIGFDNVSAAEQAAGDDEYRSLALANVSAVTVQNALVWLTTLGTQRTSDVDDLPAGANPGYIEISSGTFDDWPDAGFVKISDSGGTEKELAYYTERTSTKLTVPAAGRGMGSTSATAGAATDLVDAVPGIEIDLDTNGLQTTGAGLSPVDESDSTSQLAGLTWYRPTASDDADVLDIGSMAAAEHIQIWIHRMVMAGATEGVDVLNSIDYQFDGP